MKKLVITTIALFVFAILATCSMYPMESAPEMATKVTEEEILTPKSLQELALSTIIRNQVQLMLDKLSVETRELK